MKTLTLNEIKAQVHTQACAMGWHEPEDEAAFIARAVANQHGEVSELWESFRNGTLHGLCDKASKMSELGLPPLTCLEEEIADWFIRAFDVAGRLNVDLDKAVEAKLRFNASRGRRHGGKLA